MSNTIQHKANPNSSAMEQHTCTDSSIASISLPAMADIAPWNVVTVSILITGVVVGTLWYVCNEEQNEIITTSRMSNSKIISATSRTSKLCKFSEIGNVTPATK